MASRTVDTMEAATMEAMVVALAEVGEARTADTRVAATGRAVCKDAARVTCQAECVAAAQTEA